MLITLLATAHFLASFVALVFSFGMSMSRFDAGTPPTLPERVLWAVSDVLLLPLAALPLGTISGRLQITLEYLLFFANSVLWAVVLYAVGSLLAGILRRGSAQRGGR